MPSYLMFYVYNHRDFIEWDYHHCYYLTIDLLFGTGIWWWGQ
jgi:hypothetical protein